MPRSAAPARSRSGPSTSTGNPVEIDAEDLLSRAIQHETDHLDGKLFIDHLGPTGAGRRSQAKLREFEAQVPPGAGQRRIPQRRRDHAAARHPLMDAREDGTTPMPPPTRIVMLGTGDFALPTFVHLCETGHRSTRADHPARPAPGPEAGADPEPDQDCGPGTRDSRRPARGRERPRVARPRPLAGPRPAGDGGLRPDPLGRAAGDPSLGRDQPARLAPARLPRRRAGGPGDRARRDARRA